MTRYNPENDPTRENIGDRNDSYHTHHQPEPTWMSRIKGQEIDKSKTHKLTLI